MHTCFLFSFEKNILFSTVCIVLVLHVLPALALSKDHSRWYGVHYTRLKYYLSKYG